MTLRSTQPLTEMNTKNLPWGKGWPVRKAPPGFHSLLQGYLWLYLYSDETAVNTRQYIKTETRLHRFTSLLLLPLLREQFLVGEVSVHLVA
jgi:hypothetical protein